VVPDEITEIWEIKSRGTLDPRRSGSLPKVQFQSTLIAAGNRLELLAIEPNAPSSRIAKVLDVCADFRN
jgi:hypothetical protein